MDPITALIVILVVLWLLGAVTIGGNLIHLLLAVLLVLLILKLLR